MDIRFISSLTAEDEERIAPALLAAVGPLLDQFDLAYTIRIQTSGERVFHRSHQALTNGKLAAAPFGADFAPGGVASV